MDAKAHPQSLVGKTIPTLTGKPNRILGVRSASVIVATEQSPQGAPVAIAEVQAAIDMLCARGELLIDKKIVGYRSAFIGAVLATIPGVEVSLRPRRARLAPPKEAGA